jgi:hypothetical protein
MYNLLPTPPIKEWPSAKPQRERKAQPALEASRLKKQDNGAKDDQTRRHDKSR